MSSLHKLLSQEGFPARKPTKKVKFKPPEDSVALPIYICHDRRRLGRHGPSARPETVDRPAIDAVAIKAMVAILSGYAGRYLKDGEFRAGLREKCRVCLDKGENREIFSHMEVGIQSIEKLAEVKREKMDLESLQKSIRILNIVASLDQKPNSVISACANVYLSIIYKIAKNDKISAKHLLNVFGDSPFVARKVLLPELWEHFFLPHLLHIKIWFERELDSVANSANFDGVRAQYDDQMDIGTALFADYYKEWLKVGTQAPPVPTVPLPSKQSRSHSKQARSRRKSSESSASCRSQSSKSLYQAVFGPAVKRVSMELDSSGNLASRNVWDLDVEEKVYGAEVDFKNWNHIEKKSGSHRRSSQSYMTQKAELLLPDNKKTDYLRFLGCRTEPVECFIQGSHMSNNDENALLFQTNDIARVRDGVTCKLESSPLSATEQIMAMAQVLARARDSVICKSQVLASSSLAKAIATICSSASLTDCEAAIRTVSEAWLNSNNDPKMEASLSQASVIQCIMEILYVSNEDEILELAVSILAEIATKNEANRQCVLDSDPNLDVMIRLMRSSSLFLKGAALLYVVRPKAMQMESIEWVPLVLRVLEFGDQTQTLFSVKCSPHEAAYYFLNQLLTGFDEARNFERGKQVISLGGLGLLVRRMGVGDVSEKRKVAFVLCCCIKADGSCRHYLVKNLKKETILSLLVLEKARHCQGHVLELMTELLCLSRRNQRIEYLTGLARGWEGINTLHMLFLRLQRARPEERPVVAVILLQLDLMGDPFEYSVYREEAIDTIVKALDCGVFDEKIQEQLARALLIMGGQFSYTGEPDTERWLLRKAEILEKNNSNEEDQTNENWQRKAAIVLFTCGNTRLLSALSDSIANSLPCLARASLVTVCWMSSYLHSIGDRDLQLAACSTLAPQLIETLIDKASNLEEKILASFSLHGLTKGTDYFLQMYGLEKEVLSCLETLSRVTWTAKELISVS